MSTSSNYTKYVFQDRSGGIVDSCVTPVPHNLFGIGHAAFIPPWSDPCLYLHQECDELYLLLHGEMQLSIAGDFVDLRPNELLMILSQVPHVVMGGHGKIVAVPPMVRHNIYRRDAPYEGFTILVPVTSESDKVEDDV